MAAARVTIVCGLSPGFWRYFEASARTIPADIPVIVGWYHDSVPPELPFDNNVTFVRPREIADNFRRGYILNVAVRRVETERVLLADADMLYPRFFFDVVDDTPLDNDDVARFFVGRLTPSTTDRILAGECSWESLFSDYQGRPSFVQPTFVDRCFRYFARRLTRNVQVVCAGPMVDYLEIYGAHNPCLYSTDFLHRLRGYDERYVGWGGEDDDLTRRGRLLGARDRRLPILVGHLYHGEVVDFADYRRGSNRYEINRADAESVVNPLGWGDVAEPIPEPETMRV